MKIALAALLLFPLLASAQEKTKAPPLCKVYEMRTYHANEGKLDALHARFRDHTVQFFIEAGMTNVIYLTPTENDDNTLTYLLGYESVEAREKSWKTFLDNPAWKAAYKASTADGKLVKKIDSTFFEPTDYTPKTMSVGKGEPRLFELRTYTTNDGKLPNLDARFRDHTIDLFEKHGIENLLYLHPLEGQPGAGNTLVYLVAHKDQDSRGASFKAFGQDPAWKTARAASEEGGPLLVKKGVKNRFFEPTDYSAVR